MLLASSLSAALLGGSVGHSRWLHGGFLVMFSRRICEEEIRLKLLSSRFSCGGLSRWLVLVRWVVGGYEVAVVVWRWVASCSESPRMSLPNGRSARGWRTMQIGWILPVISSTKSPLPPLSPFSLSWSRGSSRLTPSFSVAQSSVAGFEFLLRWRSSNLRRSSARSLFRFPRARW